MSPTDRLLQKFGDAVRPVAAERGDPWFEVDADRLVAVCQYLRDDAAFGCDMLNCVSGVDTLQADPKRRPPQGRGPGIELVYHLSSTRLKHRITLKLILPRWQDEAAQQLPEAPSLTGLWPTADWHEREVYDLMGVRFVGHPNLVRILCPEDWEGHPLRKDYEMPLEYHGIRGR
ncbi:NAD(P)H-quinone oxidoreductase subunit J [Pirellulimonas nuda]|uniref:NADH-quinone oxidoreductase subunit C n=1 Tax=Pirellulimonas nuda TaxID=2528009 RepID=A0A518DEQ9_9BACT|nr:NADH-quinone oxidoreductase subunit C [Pirellulimonas nuda]QDU89961.1 NAD(P)H-quinone oxidoreductase subunit J [Pirellulimonas nuda]